MNDSEFDDLLRSAKGTIPLPGSFRHGVWQRIERESLDANRVGWRRAISLFQRPLAATLAVASMVTFGLWLGAASFPAQADNKAAYVESISPFARQP